MIYNSIQVYTRALMVLGKLFLFLSFEDLYSQNSKNNRESGEIKGEVWTKDESENLLKIENGTVVIPELKLGAFIDSTGQFVFTNLPHRSLTLFIHSPGYLSLQKNVSVSPDTVTFVKINLVEAKNVDDVVISGTLKEVSRLDSPIPVEVYSGTFLQKSPTPSVFESLGMVNGVIPQLNCNVCNTGDLHINGMEGPYTLVTIDGMPIIGGLGSVYGFSGIPNSLIQRVEVIKGPAGAIYGSEAVGGVINLITKNPLENSEKKNEFGLNIWASSYGETNADISLNQRINKNISVLTGANLFWLGQKWDLNNDNFTDIALAERVGVFHKWRITQKYDKSSFISARYVYENRWGGELNWNESYRGGNTVYGESVYTNRFEGMANISLPFEKENIRIQSSLSYHHQNSAYGTTPLLASQTIGFLQFLWDKSIKTHDLTLGGAIRYTHYDDQTTITLQPDQVLLPGIFGQYIHRFSTKHRVLGGIRMDYHNLHGLILSPRLNYQWKPNELSTLRLTLGNGFRVVNIFTEEHAALTGARTVIIKNDIQPEKSWNINLNYRSTFVFSKTVFTADITGFYTYFQNKILPDYFTNPNLIIYDNLKGYAVSRGITLNLEWSFHFPLRINAGITWMQVFQQVEEFDSIQHMTIERKIPQINAPEYSGTFQVSYQIKKLKTTIDWTGQCYGPQYLPVLPMDYRPKMSPWYLLHNVQLNYKISKVVTVFLGCKNIFNFIPKDPIMRPFDPFDKKINIDNPNGYTFDPSYNYAPIQGIRVVGGIKLNW